jgi:hypothetical protein
MVSPLLVNSRLSVASPARFASCVSTSVSNDCKREVNAAPSQTLREPMSRKVGSRESRAASLTSSYPAKRPVYRLPQQIGQRQLHVLAPARIGQVPFHECAQAQSSSSSRTRIKPPSEVTRAPWNSTRRELLNES